MAVMPKDANAKPIPCLRPISTATVDGDSAPFTSNVVRLVAAADAFYGVAGVAEVLLPAGVVEYIRVNIGDVLTTSSAVNVTEMG